MNDQRNTFVRVPAQAHHQPLVQHQQPTDPAHHNSPQTRSAKSHRYMTRQTQPPQTVDVSTCIDNTVDSHNGSNQGVLLRALPFYDRICELIQPTCLRNDGIVGRPNESLIEFRLTIDQADKVAMSLGQVQIILRFCYFDPSCEQDDNFPPDIVILVNENRVPLPPAILNPNRPNIPGKRPGQHVDISKFCKLSPFANNFAKVTWAVDPTDLTKSYAVSIMIGEKQSADTLLRRIVDRGPIVTEETKKLILDSDSEVATTNLQCSLLCPLGKMRMTNPCKSVTCHHIPCFDASTYLQMNERKATWSCPVCFQPAYFPDLRIDALFMDILEKTPSYVTDVALNADGSWTPVVKMEQQPASTKKPAPIVINISDDSDVD